MPILNPIPPGLQEVLKTARRETSKTNFKDILEDKLPVEDILDNVAQVLRDSMQDTTRLRAAELGSKLHGLLSNDSAIQVPVVNVYINGAVGEFNPILFPRETTS